MLNKTELRIWLFCVADSSIYDIFIVDKLLCKMSENVYRTRLKYGEKKLISTFYIDGIIAVVMRVIVIKALLLLQNMLSLNYRPCRSSFLYRYFV